MLVPEARTAILRVSIVAGLAACCVVGAIRTRQRWARITLGILAVPLTFFVMLGILMISLILQYGPR